MSTVSVAGAALTAPSAIIQPQHTAIPRETMIHSYTRSDTDLTSKNLTNITINLHAIRAGFLTRILSSVTFKRHGHRPRYGEKENRQSGGVRQIHGSLLDHPLHGSDCQQHPGLTRRPKPARVAT